MKPRVNDRIRLSSRPTTAIGLMVLLMLLDSGCATGGSSDSSAAIESADADREIAIRLVPDSNVVTPLGVGFGFTLTVQNNGPRSVTVPVSLSLSSPSGESVAFHSSSIFAYFGDQSTESVRVTPAQWFADEGRYTLTATVEDQVPSAQLSFVVGEPTTIVPTFVDITAQAGLKTSIPAATCGQFSNGAAWGDIDHDGDQDLLVTRLGDSVQLFINDGAGGFSEESVARGLQFSDANGAAFADYDNDGDDDLVVVRDGSDLLLSNDGRGQFDDVSAVAGIGDDNFRGMSAAWGDFDSDGNLDLYVTNYMKCLGEWSTEEEIIAQVGYFPDTLYRNNGDGTFADATEYVENDPDDPGDGSTFGAGFTAAWFDYNNDNRPDLYLANDFVGPTPDHNRLWRNDGPQGAEWLFTDVSLDSGAALFMNTMGIGIADVDRDDDLDLALSNVAGNKLLRNDGDGHFIEDQESHIDRPMQEATYASVTWGANFYDLNLDGWEDLHFAAGNFQQAPGTPVGAQPNELFVNDGTGQTFLDVSAASGADDRGDSKGVAFSDYDRDGDMDMFVTNQNGSPRLLQNVTQRAANHWLEVNAVGTRSSRDSCGASISVTIDGMTMRRNVLCGSGGSGSANQRTVHFGLGPVVAVEQVAVTWPSGRTLTMTDVSVDQVLTIEEPIT
jgi:enediyne biosynthesis protein E4